MFSGFRSFPKTILLLVLIVVALGVPSRASAQHTGFGMGFLVGEPAGINAKLWRSTSTALVGGMAWSFVHDTATDLYADYFWHNYGVFDIDRGMLPLYVGGGARLALEGESRFGLRAVVGMNYLFDTKPFDAFFEVAPVLDVAPSVDWNLNVALGMRYFFNR